MGETIPTVQYGNLRPELEASVLVIEGEDPTVFIGLKQVLGEMFRDLKNEMLGIKNGSGPTGPLPAPQPMVQQPIGVVDCRPIPLTTQGVRQPAPFPQAGSYPTVKHPPW